MHIPFSALTTFTAFTISAASVTFPTNHASAQELLRPADTMVFIALDPIFDRDDIELRETRITEALLKERFGQDVASGEAPGGGELAGCVVMTQSALDEMIQSATCGGSTDSSHSLEDALEPQVDEPDPTGTRANGDDDEFDAQGQVNDLRDEDGPGYYAGVLVVNLDADMEPVGVTVGGCMSGDCDTVDGVFSSESEDVLATPVVTVINEDAEPDPIDAAIETAVNEMLFPILARSDEEDDTNTSTDQGDSQTETPRFDDDGDVPDECEDALEDELGPGANDPIDPIDGGSDDGDPLVMGCFASAAVFDAINGCRQDLVARPGETGWTACTDLTGDGGGFVVPILTRNDLVTDPASGDDMGVQGTPDGVTPEGPSVEHDTRSFFVPQTTTIR